MYNVNIFLIEIAHYIMIVGAFATLLYIFCWASSTTMTMPMFLNYEKDRNNVLDISNYFYCSSSTDQKYVVTSNNLLWKSQPSPCICAIHNGAYVRVLFFTSNLKFFEIWHDWWAGMTLSSKWFQAWNAQLKIISTSALIRRPQPVLFLSLPVSL